jgi:hypothetical protein
MLTSRSAFLSGVRASLPVLLGAAAAGSRDPAAAQARAALRAGGDLTAIRVPELTLQNEVLYLSLGNDRLLAGIVAIAVAWR